MAPRSTPALSALAETPTSIFAEYFIGGKQTEKGTAPCYGGWINPDSGPNLSTIYGSFNRGARQGVWQQIHTVLIHRERQRQGRPPTPSAGCIDSQSIKMAHQRGPKGFDAGKQVNSRKRHC